MGCGFELAMFVFLVLPILCRNGTLAGFAKVVKLQSAIKFEEKPFWTSESEYLLSFKFLFAESI